MVESGFGELSEPKPRKALPVAGVKSFCALGFGLLGVAGGVIPSVIA